MNPEEGEPDWFAKALQEASEALASRRASRGEFPKPKFVLPPSPARRPDDAKLAADIFEAVESGKLPISAGLPTPWGMPSSAGSSPPWTGSTRPSANGTSGTTAKVSPERGLEAILKEVQGADDDELLAVAGQWITKVTNAITQIIKDREDT